jgi:hypothetical protein
MNTIQDEKSIMLFAKKWIDFYSIIFLVFNLGERCPAHIAAVRETSGATLNHCKRAGKRKL